MIQMQEQGGLGAGQKIRSVMAEQVGIEVFRTYAENTTHNFAYCARIEKISKKIKKWYDSGCKNMSLENVYIGPQEITPDYSECPAYD